MDDIYGIVLFTSFLGMYAGESFSPLTLLRVPLSVFSGLALGVLVGLALTFFFKKLHMRDTVKVLLILGLSFLVMGLDSFINTHLPFSGLVAVIALSGTILKTYALLARRISGKFSKIWVAAELLLFVLLGAAAGNIILSAAVLAILISAPLGAIGIESSYHRLLRKNEEMP